jgi:hypothetical protein
LNPNIEGFSKLFLYSELNYSKLILENGLPALKVGLLILEEFLISDNP